ncbi:MAG: DUF924 family protein [Gammaproteobacteria bacterium]
MSNEPTEVLDFWFAPATRTRWFDSTPVFDEDIRKRFETTWQQARDGQLSRWESGPEGALALTIVLDQFPLNMYRDNALRYSTEAQARTVAGRAIEQGFDAQLPRDRVAFLYLPYMHSESMADQDRSMALFSAAGLEANLEFARHHRDIVRRFGRFPHRNRTLGRTSTREEIDWLASAEAFKS